MGMKIVKYFKVPSLIIVMAFLMIGCKDKNLISVSDNIIGSDKADADDSAQGEIIDLNVMCNTVIATSDKEDEALDNGDSDLEEDTGKADTIDYEEYIDDIPDGSFGVVNRAQNNTEDYKLFCVNGEDSRQKLSYIVYTPSNCDSNIPIFIFLHGNGDKAQTFEAEIKRYAFLRHLQDGSWKPSVIFIMPIAQKKSSWSKEADNVAAIIEEVVENYGGSLDDLYISGASAGSDGLCAVAKKYDFKGAIYMAGHIAGSSNQLPTKEWFELWKNKRVFYFRDDKNGGGYGYSQNASYMDGIEKSQDDYNVDFDMVDLNWNHDIGLVDASFLPSEFMDANGRPCLDGISKLIEEE